MLAGSSSNNEFYEHDALMECHKEKLDIRYKPMTKDEIHVFRGGGTSARQSPSYTPPEGSRPGRQEDLREAGAAQTVCRGVPAVLQPCPRFPGILPGPGGGAGRGRHRTGPPAPGHRTEGASPAHLPG
jgi:hypothetical protein